jgi:superfamily II DNA or RNA helicase
MSVDINLKLRIKRKINSYVPQLYDELNNTTPTFIDVLKKCELDKTINKSFRLYCYECYSKACINNEIEPLPYEDEKILRYYQENGFNNIIQNLNTDNRTLCHMPTGAGKTVLAYAVMANTIQDDIQTFIIISPLIRLNNQNIKRKYLNVLINNNYNTSNNNKRFKTIEVNCKNKNWQTKYSNYKGRYNIIFSTTYASFYLVDKYFQDNNIVCNMLIADECHTIPAKVNINYYYDLDNNVEYKKMNGKQKKRVKGWKSLFLNNITYHKRLFLTATPYTHQESAVDGYYNSLVLYGKVVKPITIKELIEKGYLANIIPYEAFIKSRENNEGFNADIAQCVMKFSTEYNRKRVCIYVNRKSNGNNLIEAFKTNELFNEMNDANSVEIYGYFDNCNNDDYIDFSENESLTRDETILDAFGQNETTENFDDSKLKIIVSVRKLTMGIDVPCIDTIVFADPKLSKSDFAQAVGRGLRPFEYLSGIKKECYLLLIDSSNDEFIDMIVNFIEYAKQNLAYAINHNPRAYKKSDIPKAPKNPNEPRPILYNGVMEFDFRIMERYKILYQNNNDIKTFCELKKIFNEYNIKCYKDYEEFMSNNKIYKLKTNLLDYEGFNFQYFVDTKKEQYYSTKDECLEVIDNIDTNGLKNYVTEKKIKKILKLKNINLNKYYHLIDNKIPNMNLDLFYGK